MSANFVWRVFDKHMNQLIRLFKKCPPEQRKVIPDGFTNNVHWHLGHVLFITEHEVLGLSERPLVLPESYKDFFAFGTKPADWTEDPPEWDLLIAQLKELRHYIHVSLEHRWTEPVGENFLRAQNISELLYLTSLHLSYHQGVVYGMLKTMSMKTNEEEQFAPSYSAIFAGGCFWSLEAAFRELDGVTDVVTGYTGGQDEDPTYKKVVSNHSDHLEAVQVQYNPEVITYDELLEAFWKNINPTIANLNNESLSAIFYTNHVQKVMAELSRDKLMTSGRFNKPVVTKIAEATPFYKAEEEHQNYYGRTRVAKRKARQQCFISRYSGVYTS